MGASKKLYEEMDQRIILEVSEAYYNQYYEIFEPPNTKIIRVFPANEQELFKNDPVYANLKSDYYKASKALNDYKFNKRHKPN